MVKKGGRLAAPKRASISNSNLVPIDSADVDPRPTPL